MQIHEIIIKINQPINQSEAEKLRFPNLNQEVGPSISYLRLVFQTES